MISTEPTALIPVTLLTGFLGSGKTTVLNHVLKQPGMAATAVIVNEFGEIGLDHLLVERSSEDVVLLNSGCLCCTVRGDIVDTLTNLFVDRVKGKVPFFTRVAIETTGLADPAPILHTLMTDPIVAARYVLDGVVTTVDAVNGAGSLDRQPEAVKQAAVADRLLLTKTDIAEPGARQAIEARLKELNPSAAIVSVAQGAIDSALLFNIGFYDPTTKSLDVRRWLRDESFEGDHGQDVGHGHEHPDVNRHDDRIRAFCITREQPISWAALSTWLDGLAAMRGDDLLRLKAIVALSDRPDQPVVLHGVQHLFHPPVLLPEWPSEDRRTRMVFITRDLPRETIETTLAAFEEAVEERPSSQSPPRELGNGGTRRNFLVSAGSIAAATAFAGSARAVMGPDDKFDLVIKGGEVLDPSQSLRGRRDIGIRYGIIEALEPEIPAPRGLRVLDASGKLVTPGLVDLHTHVYPYGSAIGIPADELVAHQCTTTCVSAGDAGANNFAAFRRFIVAQTRTRLCAFIHIANSGLASFPVAELTNIDVADVSAAAKAIAENGDIVIGAKVRMSENVIAKNGIEPLKRAIAACEQAGTGGRVMVHIGGVETRALMSQILDLMRPGDVLTHAYSGAPNLSGDFTNIVEDGSLLPAALAAKQRGIIFDVGHGGGSFDYTVAEVAIAQGCTPDTISSDIHVFSGNTPGMPYLTWVMSKFLGLGFTLDQVIAMATINPAKIINRLPKLGTLELGAPGDVAIMDLVEGPVTFVDTRNNTRGGKAYLKPVQTVTAGVPFGRPYNAPFSVR
ncbi:MAG TPA: GTP-binding protein [Stellaceae bacterium]|jgi:dihydroorotase|nr:GTP-binding protein [Stellaceae bacterium]